MAKTLDDMKMVHEEEMQNYDRIQEAVTRVMHRHAWEVLHTERGGSAGGSYGGM